MISFFPILNTILGTVETTPSHQLDSKPRKNSQERVDELFKEAQKFHQKASEEGAQSSYRDACFWYKEAAKLGHIEAQFHLALLLSSNCPGVTCDKEEARTWYEKAASKGHLKAKLALEENCSHDFDLSSRNQIFKLEQAKNFEIRKDYRAAYLLYKEVSRQKNIDVDSIEALFKLAQAYEHGLGTKKSRIRSLKYYAYVLQIAKSIHPQIYSFCEKKLEQAVNDYIKFDSGESCYFLAYMYSQGYGGLKKDIEKSAALYEKAAEYGISQAQYRVGLKCLASSRAEERERGEILLFESAKKGFKRAQFELRNWYKTNGKPLP